jgi:xanthine dehydrogenase accessory factor
MAKDLLELANEFSHSGEAFALATVVWRRVPSSGKVGYKALVTPDGKVSGWVAGACTEPLVVRQSLKAMADGNPRLMLIGAPEDLETRARDGLLTFPTTCASEGALEIYVEPHLPTVQLVVIGRSPVVDTMASVANTLGWRTVIVDDEGGSFSDHSVADRVVNSLNLAEDVGVNSSSYVVVATLGHYDEDALQAALKTDAAYIGLVASRKRAATVMDYLREEGVSAEELKRISAPAGLDLGRIAHEEMAVAVIAEMIKVKAESGNAGLTAGPVHSSSEDQSSGAASPNGSAGSQSHDHAGHHHGHEHPAQDATAAEKDGAHAGVQAASETAPVSAGAPAAESAGATPEEEAIDPVCGMTVGVRSARYKAEHEGTTYYFCCPACRKLFQANPQEYLKVKL